MKKFSILFLAALVCGCSNLFNMPTCSDYTYPRGNADGDKSVYLAEIINYKSGETALKNKNAENLKMVSQLAKEKNAIVIVVGHASHKTLAKSEQQQLKINTYVSVKRAKNVADTLVALGVDKHNVEYVGLSDLYPQEENPSKDALNRRVEVFLIF